MKFKLSGQVLVRTDEVTDRIVFKLYDRLQSE